MATPAARQEVACRGRFASTATALLRPRSAQSAVCLLALYMLVATNWPLWRALVSTGVSAWATALAIAGMAWLLLSALVAFMACIAWSRWMRPVWIGLVAVAAAVQYYAANYHVVMDSTMADNILRSDPAEVRGLLSGGLLLQMLVVVAPAAAWISRITITRRPFWSELWHNALLVMAALIAGAACVGTMSRTLAPLIRSQPQLRYQMNPVATLWSVGAALTRPWLRRRAGLVAITGGTALGPSYAQGTRPPLLLIVVGETARADHFGINGYDRNTTPELAAAHALSWAHVTSCGTSTFVSLPCMFSPLERAQFFSRNQDSENLLDVLQAAGLAVLWLDNQGGGCKGVCDRIPHFQVNDAAAHPAACGDGECLDRVLLDELDARVAALPQQRLARGLVVVLHQLGSHGPAYYRRSPADAKRFLPECREAVLSNCSQEELINAYDNSIAYTDALLGEAIAWLRGRSGRFASGLLYVSDHGESLGEYGLYLHGAPWSIAPRVQKHVPMTAWLDGGLARRAGLDLRCLRRTRDRPLSHHNLFSSVLGLLDIRNPRARADLDMFASCAAPGSGRRRP